MQPHYKFTGFLGKRVHLGVTGSVAAYKAVDLVRALIEADCSVSATLTDSCQKFITKLTFEALGANPVYGTMFSHDVHTTFGHLEPGQDADVLVVAPASASTMARLAHGLADDMLSCQALAFPGPKIVAPAMNPRMWNAMPTQENWETLGRFGYERVLPGDGLVACGETGSGRLAPIDEIFARTLRALSPKILAGKKVLITLGPTREPWDAVRFWSNPSTGLMGSCLAMAAYLQGAEVTLVCGPTEFSFPSEITVIPVSTAVEMYDHVTTIWPKMDIACCTAAVADFRPVRLGNKKFKKGDQSSLAISFEANPDTLAELGRMKRAGQQLIGFAAETEKLEQSALAKLQAKNLDLIAANDISNPDSGFAASTNQMFILSKSGRSEKWPTLPKTEVAWRIWNQLCLS